jgi:hypothetical protein
MEWLGGKLTDTTFIAGITLGNFGDEQRSVDAPSMVPPGRDKPASSNPYEITQCTLILNWLVTPPPASGNAPFSVKIIIPLSDIEPLSIQPHRDPRLVYGTIHLKTSNSKRTLKWSSAGWGEITATELTVFATNDDNLNRLERGFKHAVKLCSGKVDPF